MVPVPPPAPPRSVAVGMTVTPPRSTGSPNTRDTVMASRTEVTISGIFMDVSWGRGCAAREVY